MSSTPTDITTAIQAINAYDSSKAPTTFENQQAVNRVVELFIDEYHDFAQQVNQDAWKEWLDNDTLPTVIDNFGSFCTNKYGKDGLVKKNLDEVLNQLKASDMGDNIARVAVFAKLNSLIYRGCSNKEVLKEIIANDGSLSDEKLNQLQITQEDYNHLQSAATDLDRLIKRKAKEKLFHLRKEAFEKISSLPPEKKEKKLEALKEIIIEEGNSSPDLSTLNQQLAIVFDETLPITIDSGEARQFLLSVADSYLKNLPIETKRGVTEEYNESSPQDSFSDALTEEVFTGIYQIMNRHSKPAWMEEYLELFDIDDAKKMIEDTDWIALKGKVEFLKNPKYATTRSKISELAKNECLKLIDENPSTNLLAFKTDHADLFNCLIDHDKSVVSRQIKEQEKINIVNQKLESLILDDDNFADLQHAENDDAILVAYLNTKFSTPSESKFSSMSNEAQKKIKQAIQEKIQDYNPFHEQIYSRDLAEKISSGGGGDAAKREAALQIRDNPFLDYNELKKCLKKLGVEDDKVDDMAKTQMAKNILRITHEPGTKFSSEDVTRVRDLVDNKINAHTTSGASGDKRVLQPVLDGENKTDAEKKNWHRAHRLSLKLYGDITKAEELYNEIFSSTDTDPEKKYFDNKFKDKEKTQAEKIYEHFHAHFVLEDTDRKNEIERLYENDFEGRADFDYSLNDESIEKKKKWYGLNQKLGIDKKKAVAGGTLTAAGTAAMAGTGWGTPAFSVGKLSVPSFSANFLAHNALTSWLAGVVPFYVLPPLWWVAIPVTIVAAGAAIYNAIEMPNTYEDLDALLEEYRPDKILSNRELWLSEEGIEKRDALAKIKEQIDKEIEKTNFAKQRIKEDMSVFSADDDFYKKLQSKLDSEEAMLEKLEASAKKLEASIEAINNLRTFKDVEYIGEDDDFKYEVLTDTEFSNLKATPSPGGVTISHEGDSDKSVYQSQIVGSDQKKYITMKNTNAAIVKSGCEVSCKSKNGVTMDVAYAEMTQQEKAKFVTKMVGEFLKTYPEGKKVRLSGDPKSQLYSDMYTALIEMGASKGLTERRGFSIGGYGLYLKTTNVSCPSVGTFMNPTYNFNRPLFMHNSDLKENIRSANKEQDAFRKAKQTMGERIAELKVTDKNSDFDARVEPIKPPTK